MSHLQLNIFDLSTPDFPFHLHLFSLNLVSFPRYCSLSYCIAFKNSRTFLAFSCTYLQTPSDFTLHLHTIYTCSRSPVHLNLSCSCTHSQHHCTYNIQVHRWYLHAGGHRPSTSPVSVNVHSYCCNSCTSPLWLSSILFYSPSSITLVNSFLPHKLRLATICTCLHIRYSFCTSLAFLSRNRCSPNTFQCLQIPVFYSVQPLHTQPSYLLYA